MNTVSLLAALPDMAFGFMLVLARTGTAVMLMPGLGEAEPPPMVRAGLVLAVTALVLPGVAPLMPNAGTAIGAAAMLVTELCVGILLGWLARLPVLALSMAGATMSYMLGLSNVVQTDPALGGQSAALARLFGLAAPVLILSTGLYALPLSALAGSYQVLAPGTILPPGPLADTILAAVSASFGLAIQLSAPFIFAGFVFQCALGLLARLVPQLQAYSAAAPGQILGGLMLLALIGTPILGQWTEVVRSGWSELIGL